jgi:hypothetical protein
VHGGPKVDERQELDAGEDLVAHYEVLRAAALTEGATAGGLAAALLVAQGMPAWMRGWRACAPAPARPPVLQGATAPTEVVGVLAAMALACA